MKIKKNHSCCMVVACHGGQNIVVATKFDDTTRKLSDIEFTAETYADVGDIKTFFDLMVAVDYGSDPWFYHIDN